MKAQRNISNRNKNVTKEKFKERDIKLDKQI